MLEGFALGVQDTQAEIVSLFVSLIIHKGVEAFSVGLQAGKMLLSHCSGLKGRTQKAVAFLFYCGDLLDHDADWNRSRDCLAGQKRARKILQAADFDTAWKGVLTAFLESMACGTFIYITFLEVGEVARRKITDTVDSGRGEGQRGALDEAILRSACRICCHQRSSVCLRRMTDIINVPKKML